MYTVMMCVHTAALKFYRRTDDVDSDMEEMDTEDTSGAAAAAAAGDDAAVGSQPYTLRQLLTAADLRRPLFIACMLQVIQQFSGINAVSTILSFLPPSLIYIHDSGLPEYRKSPQVS